MATRTTVASNTRPRFQPTEDRVHTHLPSVGFTWSTLRPRHRFVGRGSQNLEDLESTGRSSEGDAGKDQVATGLAVLVWTSRALFE